MEVAGKEGVTFFKGLQFPHKKLKFVINKTEKSNFKVGGEGGGGSQKTNIKEGFPNKRGLGQFVDLREEGGWTKKKVG